MQPQHPGRTELLGCAFRLLHKLRGATRDRTAAGDPSTPRGYAREVRLPCSVVAVCSAVEQGSVDWRSLVVGNAAIPEVFGAGPFLFWSLGKGG